MILVTDSGTNAQPISPSSTKLDIKNGFSKIELGTKVDEVRKITKVQIAGKNT